MSIFDRALNYRFSIIFEPPADGIQPEKLRELPTIVAKEEHPDSHLRLRLGEAQQQQGLALQGSTFVAAGSVVWTAGSGIWRLILFPNCLDLIFDAHGFLEMIDEHVDLNKVYERVSDGFPAAVEHLGARVNRLALIVVGEISAAVEPHPSVKVAQHFFNESINRFAEKGETRDLSARVNQRIAWPIGPSSTDKPAPVEVNCIEAASVRWNYTPGGPEVTLVWQWEVNTAPEIVANAAFNIRSHQSFLKLAVDWIVTKMKDFEREPT